MEVTTLQRFFIVSIFSLCIHSYSKDISSSEKKTESSYVGLLNIEKDIDRSMPIITKLIQTVKDPNIKGLIIRIDCYGGSLASSQAILSELKKFRQNKPIIVLIENYCFSCAYYVAIGADYIFALPSSEVGSIGTVTTFRKYKNLTFDENGRSGDMDIYVLRSGKYKDIGNGHIPLEDWHINYYKQKVQKHYEQFVADVAQERNLSIEDEKKWADGHWFVGTEALELGLIDALGDFSDAMAKMKELLGVRGITFEGELDIIDINMNKTD